MCSPTVMHIKRRFAPSFTDCFPSPKRHQKEPSSESSLTGRQLHPSADLVDAAGVAEEEETEADDAADHEEHGDPHEEHGRLERARGDGAEVQRAALARELAGERVTDAVVEEAEVSRLRSVDTVSDPVGLDEHHHGDDGEHGGEHLPQDPDGPRVSHVVGVIDFGSFLSRYHTF